MYRLKDIKAALMPLVGWRQAYNPEMIIDNDLTNTESGLYYQDAHPLLTLENMSSIIPDDWGYRYPEWNMNETYNVGKKVRHGERIWIAVRENVNSEPVSTENYLSDEDKNVNPDWAVYNMLSDFLRQLTDNAISSMIQTFIQIKNLERETRNLLERRTFFDGAGRLRDTVTNRGRLVGFEIIPVRSNGVTAKIEKIGLQMTGATGLVRMYLFHSSQSAPIKSFDLEFTVKNGGFQWFELKDCYLPYLGSNTNAGGSWFLCYNQDDLPLGMEAINVSKDWSREPCGTCNIGSVETWRELTKYLQISPFAIGAPEDFAEYPEMWDISETLYTNTTSYGINVEVSVGCDLTDFIISQRYIFATVLQRQLAVNAMRTLAMNPDVRVNRNQANASRMEILYELDGNTAGTRPNGLGYELAKSYKALRFDTQGLDRICLSCNNRGVKFTSV